MFPDVNRSSRALLRAALAERGARYFGRLPVGIESRLQRADDGARSRTDGPLRLVAVTVRRGAIRRTRPSSLRVDDRRFSVAVARAYLNARVLQTRERARFPRVAAQHARVNDKAAPDPALRQALQLAVHGPVPAERLGFHVDGARGCGIVQHAAFGSECVRLARPRSEEHTSELQSR